MAQIVIKNIDGKVIKNVAGNVLRQNFQFGRGFMKGAVNAHMRIPNTANIISVSTPFTILMWLGTAAASAGYIRIVNAAGASRWNLLTDSSTNNIEVMDGGTFLHQAQVAGTVGTGIRNLMGVKYTGSGTSGNLTFIVNTSRFGHNINFGTSPLTSLFFNHGQRSTGPLYGVVSDEMLVYNRMLSEAEITYIFNSRAGNEPSTQEGLKVWLRNDAAEILDFSIAQDGSDLRPGMRDLSGNFNHADFINIPAGTNQEKVDYVNNNLLSLW